MDQRIMAFKVLRGEFPDSTVGLSDQAPYARNYDGRLFGILFDMDKKPAEPWAIIEYVGGHISPHRYTIYKVLEGV